MQAKELHFSANRFLGQDLWTPHGAVDPGRSFVDCSVALKCLKNDFALDSCSRLTFFVCFCQHHRKQRKCSLKMTQK